MNLFLVAIVVSACKKNQATPCKLAGTGATVEDAAQKNNRTLGVSSLCKAIAACEPEVSISTAAIAKTNIG